MTLFLVASGLTLIFGVVNVFNFAHARSTCGAYFAYQVVAVSGVDSGREFSSRPSGRASGGVLMEFLFLRRIYGRAGEAGFQICSLQLHSHPGRRRQDDLGDRLQVDLKPETLSGLLVRGGHDAAIRPGGDRHRAGRGVRDVAAIKKTRFGRNLRAISSNREMASSLG